jgi:hypothetical protein
MCSQGKQNTSSVSQSARACAAWLLQNIVAVSTLTFILLAMALVDAEDVAVS